MSVLRRDIAEAAAKMVVTFGTRSAVRGLEDELELGERVLAMAACTFAGAEGVAALTDLRVIAIRNDYSKHQVQFVPLEAVQTLDYDPTVHDGFALFTPTSRLVVRKMRREDGDRLVDALLTRAPHIVIHVTRPVGTPPVQPPPQLGPLGRHRKPAAVRPAEPARAPAQWAPEPSIAPAESPVTASAASAPAATAPGASAPAPAASAPAAATSAEFAAQESFALAPAVAAQGAAAHHVTHAVPSAAPVVAGSVAAPTASGPVGGSASGATVDGGAARPASDKEVLLGLLTDLHTQGVLTTEEFAAKVRLIVQQP